MTNPTEDLTPIEPKGKPPESRLNSYSTAMNIYRGAKESDELSMKNRVVVQAMLDGAPPYNDEALRLSGSGYRYNLNFLQGTAILDSAQTSYSDLVDSVEYMARVKLPLNIGDPIQRSDWEDIISEEFHRLIRSWPEFDSRYQRIIMEMLAHGVGFASFPDEDSWKFDAGGWDDFLIPRQTPASEEQVEILIGRRRMLIHQLYAYVKDEDTARKRGWNVDEVRKVIACASKTGKQDTRGWAGEWARLQKELKNNDLCGYESQDVEVIHFWVREFDGKYSHYMAAEKCTDFLFKQRDRFSNANNAFVTFMNCASQNGTYHGIRGLGYRIFPLIQVLNRARCAILDGMQISNSIFLKPDSADDMEVAALTLNGPVAYMHPNFSFEDVKFANPAQGSLAVINDLTGVAVSNTPQYRGGAVLPRGGERTKYEVQAQQELDSSLSVNAVNMFYRSWRKLLQEIFRRVQAGKDADSKQFFKWCAERGVGADLIKKVNQVEPLKAVGYGSASQRMLAFDEASRLMGSFDERGRRAVIRDQLAARFGRDVADRYAPRIEQPRPVIDEKIAQLENGVLRTDPNILVQEGENHAVHSAWHIDAMLKSANVWEEQRMAGQMDFDSLAPELQFVQNALVHTWPHVDALSLDPTRETEAASYRQALNNIDGMWQNFTLMYQRHLRDNRNQSPDELPDAEGMQKLQQNALEHEQKIAQMRETHRVKLDLQSEEVAAKIQFQKLQSDIKASDEVRKQTIQRNESRNS